MIRFDKFANGKSKIVTMSYDDGTQFDRQLIEIFNQYGIKGAFHINSGGIGMEGRVTAQDIKTLYLGHEVSLHAHSHPFLNRIPNETLVSEIIEERKTLEGLTGYVVRGMSYPFGAYDDATIQKLKALGVVYSRTTKPLCNFNLPDDFMQWHPTCHHHDGLEHAKKFISLIERTDHHHLLYIWGHSYEFDRENNWNLIEEICKTLAGRDEIWYATNIEIYNYITAQKRLVVSADQKLIYNPSALTVWISSDGEAVEIPGGASVNL